MMVAQKRSLLSLSTDEEYWGRIFGECFLEGLESGDEVIEGILTSFSLTSEEREYLTGPASGEYGEVVDVISFIIRVNSKALATQYLYNISINEMAQDPDDLIQAVNSIIREIGTLNTKVHGKLNSLKRFGDEGESILEAAFRRLQQAQAMLNQEYDRIKKLEKGVKYKQDIPSLDKKKEPKARAAKPVRAVKEEGGQIKGFFRRKEAVIITGALVLLIMSIGFFMFQMGWFADKSTGFVEIKVDLSSIDIAVHSTTAKGIIMEVVVGNEWNEMSKQKKIETVKSIYQVAVKNNLQWVNVKSANGDVLAKCWVKDEVIIYR